MENQDATTPTEPSMSLGSRITNVFASPSEAFAGISSMESKTSLWLWPWLVTIVLLVIFTFVMFSNETLRQQIMEVQTKSMEQRVASGQMTQQQADQAQAGMERMGGFMSAIAAVGVVIVTTIYFFAGALIFWLVGKFALKSSEGYGSYLGMYGTSAWIGVLGALISMLMILGIGSLYATPSAALAVFSNFDPLNTTHRILSKLDVFAAWQAVVLGIGLGKLTGKSTGTTIGISVGMWIVWALGTGFLKIGG